MRTHITAPLPLIHTAVVIVATLLAAITSSCEKADVKLNHIYLTAETEKMAPGDTIRLSLHAYPEKANIGFPDAPIIWSSSDTLVATVDQEGLVAALKYGQVTIKVTFGPLSATKTLTVSSVAGVGDSVLEKYLISRFDTNGDGVLEGYETASYTGLDLSELAALAGEDTVDMAGLYHFVNIQTLRIENVNMRNLNLFVFSQLREVHLDRCGISSLDLRQASQLTDVRIMSCSNLKEVLLGSYADYGANKLHTFQCSRCDISSLDLSRSGATLWDIDVAGNPRLSSLDLTVDTMVHSVVYSCGTTTVIWPENVEVSEIIKECQEWSSTDSGDETESGSGSGDESGETGSDAGSEDAEAGSGDGTDDSTTEDETESGSSE